MHTFVSITTTVAYICHKLTIMLLFCPFHSDDAFCALLPEVKASVFRTCTNPPAARVKYVSLATRPSHAPQTKPPPRSRLAVPSKFTCSTEPIISIRKWEVTQVEYGQYGSIKIYLFNRDLYCLERLHIWLSLKKNWKWHWMETDPVDFVLCLL